MQSFSPHKRLVIWDPLQSNRFIVGGGGDIKLHSWDPRRKEIRRIAVQTDLSLMKCMAWSPHPLYDDLVAVGLSTGRVDILKLTANTTSSNFAPNSFPNPAAASLPVRYSRACNALAFSSMDPNYLAVGLDKVRHDPSLVIWDVEAAAASLAPLPTNDASESLDSRKPQRSLPRFPGGEARSGDARPLQQYGSTDAIYSLAFIPSSAGPSLLMAGVGLKWLRLHDLRSPTSNTVLTIATKAVYGLCVDPFDDYKVASFGDDGGIRIWDRRRSNEPVLAFSEGDAGGDGGRLSAITEIGFSSNRRGLFGSLERDAPTVRLWDLVSNVPLEDTPIPPATGDEGVRSLSAGRSDAAERWKIAEEYLPPVLFHTRRGTDFRSPISSFAFASNGGASYETPYILVTSKKGDISLTPVQDPIMHKWSPNGDLAATMGPSCKVFATGGEMNRVEPWAIDYGGPVSILNTTLGGDEELRTGRSTSPHHRNAIPGTLSLTRMKQTKTRTYSPSSMRHLPPGLSVDGEFSRSTSRHRHIPTKGVSSRVTSQLNEKVRNQISSGSDESPEDEGITWRAVHADISVLIKRRVLQGYGLESMRHNASIARREGKHEQELAGIWEWVELSRDVLGITFVHGFNFAFQGILSIWEGFPPAPPSTREEGHPSSHSIQAVGVGRTASSRGKKRAARVHSPSSTARDQFDAAVESLNNRKERAQASATLVQDFSTKGRRQLALALCKWDFTAEEFKEEMRRWEKHGWYSKAACWAVFIHDYQYAVDCLARSSDERHRILASTVAGLTPQETTAKGENPQARIWREQCERTGLRLEDPYLRAMMTYLLADGFWDLLQEETLLPLRDRLAMALSFLDDILLSSYLREVTGDLKKEGSLEGLLLTGLNELGIGVLQNYVDCTGDVQTAAILATLVSPLKFKDLRVERWVEAYEDLLDSWNLFHFRCEFDIARGRLLQEAILEGESQPFEWVERQLLVRCNYCNKVVNSQQPPEVPVHALGSAQGGARSTCCQTCHRTLPKCIICLTAVGISNDSRRDAELAYNSSEKDTLDDALIVCQTCRHGGHTSHILDWFLGGGGPPRSVCAAADCSCRCLELQ